MRSLSLCVCVCVCGARICTRENERKERRRRGYCERPDTFVACVHSTQPPGAATVPSGAEMTSAYLIPVNEETFLSLSTSSHSSSCSSNSLSPSAPSPCASISLSLSLSLSLSFSLSTSLPLSLSPSADVRLWVQGHVPPGHIQSEQLAGGDVEEDTLHCVDEVSRRKLASNIRQRRISHRLRVGEINSSM